MLTLHEFEQTKNLMIAAHRGSSGTITENTVAAFVEAINAGIDLIELDIQFTYDNYIVVFHDFYPPGFDKKISELKYEQIKNIKIGPFVSHEFDSVHIPLLKDVLTVVKNKCYLMIEIKVNTGKKFMDNVNELINIIVDNNFSPYTIFGSFSYSSLIKIKELNSIIYTAAIKIPGDVRLPSEIQNEINCDAFICSIDELNTEIIEDAAKNRIFTGAYNIDDEISVQKAIDLGVRAIATNFPEKIMKYVKK